MTQGFVYETPTAGTLTVPEGGTGATTLTGVLTGNGTSPITGNAITQYGVVIGGASNAVASTAVGTATEVLTSNGAGVAPTFQAVAAGAGSGLKFLASATASTSSSLDFETGIDATYNMYVWIIEEILPATDDARIYINTSSDGGSSYDASTNNYKYNGWFLKSTTFSNTGGGGGAPYLGLTIMHGNAAGEGGSGIVYCWNPSDTVETRFMWDMQYKDTTGAQIQQHGQGVRESAADVDAVRFIMNTGNIASGKISMYGMTTPS